jgi:hypothetical protein
MISDMLLRRLVSQLERREMISGILLKRLVSQIEKDEE